MATTASRFRASMGGLPQSLRRVYIIGISRLLCVATQCFQACAVVTALADLLDPHEDDDYCKRLPSPTRQTARTHLTRELAGLTSLAPTLLIVSWTLTLRSAGIPSRTLIAPALRTLEVKVFGSSRVGVG